MREYLTTAEVSALTGVPIDTLRDFRRPGGITQPDFRGRRGVKALWSRPRVLGIRTARTARSVGADLRQAGAFLEYLASLSVAQLERHFARGKRYALVFNGRVFPTLVHQESVTENPVVQEALPDAWAAGLAPVLIDVQAIWNRLKEAIAALDQQEAEATTAKG